VDAKTQRVIDAGAALGVEVAPHTFPAETRTAADAASAVGCDVAQIVKSLVFGSDRGPLLFLVSGANRLDPTLAARAAGVDELTKADAGEAKSATGFSIGATPPFGHTNQLPTFMDEDLLLHSEVWAAAGRPDSVFPVAASALQEATGAVVCALREKS
jgi:prolyl-tRNA editing enzyme YbaK/EbsC (Cys-tRNA(Pro) deacylase)